MSQTIAGSLVIVAAPSAAPQLSGSLSSGQTLTLNWTGVSGGASYEVQQTNAAGTGQVSIFSSGVTVTGGSSGTQTRDAQGVYADFVTGTSVQLQLPAGATLYFRVRAVTGTGGTGLAGPWSNVVQAATPAGTPNIVLSVSGVSFGAVDTSTNPPGVPVTFTVTAKNQGTAAGLLAAMWAITVPQFGSTPNAVIASQDVGPWYSGVMVPAGGQVSVTISSTSGAGLLPLLSSPQPFSIHVALSVQQNPSAPFYTYQGSSQDYVYQHGQTLQPVSGDRAFSFSYGG